MKYQIRSTIILILLINALGVFSQPVSNIRHRVLRVSEMEWQLDTTGVFPGSFTLLRENGDTIPDSLYTLTGWKAELKLSSSADWTGDSVLLAVYRVFPVRVLPVYTDERLKPERELRKTSEISYLYSYSDLQSQDESFLNFGSLQRSGSISRAISIGNNQDAVLNSTMNLQLSGELAPGIEVVAAITDNTIPIQPDGASQQLREFDKVFIKASAQSWELVAGDFEIQNGTSSFLRFNKKAQGLLFRSDYTAGTDERWKMTSQISGAVARGKYTSYSFSGIEGNQGPYKLYGANNEQFIVVLAGSERIYMDGKLLTRGANNDYVIDYNSAQITFTPALPVTKDKRFDAFFEYAERNYNRSMVYASQQASTDKVTLQVQYFVEQDMKGQPMSQEKLIEENIDLLSSIGDDLAQAVVPNVKEVPFNNSEVLYKRIDTLVGSTLYTSVFVYSTNPDSARYRLGFSYVGTGNGNYRQTSSAANGKVFVWVAPQGGIPQGDHEPVILLVTPKRQQMLTLSGAWQTTPLLNLFAEAAISGLDMNTYSSVDNDDNTGLALTAGFLKKRTPQGEDSSRWNLEAEGFYRWIGKEFSVVERFKDIEFERDWNITGGQEKTNEHYAKVRLGLFHKDLLNTSYIFEPLVTSSENYALRHSVSVNALAGAWRMTGQGSLMNNENSFLPGTFIRHSINLERRKGFMVAGILQEGEDNRLRVAGRDSLHGNSFAFQRWQASLERADSAGLRTRVRLGQRYDMLPAEGALTESSRADEAWAGVGSTKNPAHQFDLNVGYRILNLVQQPPGSKPEESLLGRAEYNHRLFKGLIRGSVFYEFGSGLEYKKEFSYLEVAPGQGIYTWIDYNGDSIKQLDEFEVAAFQDEASYIRVFTPTNEFERVYTMQYNQTINIDPAAVVNRDKALGKLLARFYNQGHYRVEQKVGGENIMGALNPMFTETERPELISLNYSLRNTLFYNRSSSKYSIDYTTARNESRVLLVNGFEERGQIQHTLRVRWNITREYILRTEGSTGRRERASEFFAANDFRLALWGAAAELQYQPGTKYRIGAKYQYSDKVNAPVAGGEHARLHRASTEFRYSIPMKGTMQALVEYIGISYNSTDQSSIAFEMLEGLRTGNNFTWTLGYQRILGNNMQISLQYNGRKSPTNPMVHVGTVQVRAFF